MPKMEADCVHGYDMGDGCPVCKPKPEVGKPFTFTVKFDLHYLTNMDGIDGLNTAVDEEFWDKYGDGLILVNISYKPLSVNPDGTINIEVHAEDVEGDDDAD